MIDSDVHPRADRTFARLPDDEVVTSGPVVDHRRSPTLAFIETGAFPDDGVAR